MHAGQLKHIKTRKRHRCDWCNGWIESGSVVPSWFYADDGIAATLRMHPECHRAMKRRYCSEDEFVTGDSPFGCDCRFSAGCVCGWDRECSHCGGIKNKCRQAPNACCPDCDHYTARTV
jgi:hypothetical protein